MGRNKALLEYGGQPLIQYSLKLAGALTSEIYIIDNGRDLNRLGYPVVRDIFPVSAPLAGIHAGIMASTNAWNLVLTCDMPGVSPELIRYMITLLPERRKVLVPIHNGLVEPLCGFWHRDMLPELENQLNSERYSPLELIRNFPERMTDISGDKRFNPALLFRNINNPADLSTRED